MSRLIKKHVEYFDAGDEVNFLFGCKTLTGKVLKRTGKDYEIQTWNKDIYEADHNVDKVTRHQHPVGRMLEC